MVLKKGDIIFLNRIKSNNSFYSACQRFFTGYPYSHVALFVGRVLNNQSVLSSEELNIIRPFRNILEEKDTEIEVFSIRGIDERELELSLIKLYKNIIGKPYGFFQILWFIWRWINDKIGRDVKLHDNPFKEGIICSESIYIFLRDVEEYIPGLKDKLDEYKQNNVHVGDIHDIIISFPQYFKLIFVKNYKKA